MRDATHITLIGDRSGSMQQVQEAAESGINKLLDDQKAFPGDCTLLLVDFDGLDSFHVIHDGNLATVPRYRLEPRDMTPLYDAVGIGIERTGEILSALPEENRPDKVIFAIQTDGQENASRRFNMQKIREMIEHQRTVYGWQIVFLGVGPDSWSQGQAMGIDNNTRSVATHDSMAGAYSNHSQVFSAYRSTGDAQVFAKGTNATVAADGTVILDEDEDDKVDTTIRS